MDNDQTTTTLTGSAAKRQAMPLTRNVSMTEREEGIVLRFQQETGLRSFSGAWCLMVNEWEKLTGRDKPAANQN